MVRRALAGWWPRGGSQPRGSTSIPSPTRYG